jgi:hypothetical protein
MVLSHRPDRHTQAVAELGTAINGTVVLDTTAVTTLALLDSAIVEQLTGQFTRLESTDTAYRDALGAQQAPWPSLHDVPGLGQHPGKRSTRHDL